MGSAITQLKKYAYSKQMSEITRMQHEQPAWVTECAAKMMNTQRFPFQRGKTNQILAAIFGI
jgi:hypothetical protein